jgi:hypothetical protein
MVGLRGEAPFDQTLHQLRKFNWWAGARSELVRPYIICDHLPVVETDSEVFIDFKRAFKSSLM